MDPLWPPVPADHSGWPPGTTTARLPFGCMTSRAPALPLVWLDQSGVWPGAVRTRLPLPCMVRLSWPLVNGAAALNKGDTPLIVCIDNTSNPLTQFGEGNLNAILISSSNGGSNAAAAQSPSRKLTIIKR
jgi:hypothetical protein